MIVTSGTYEVREDASFNTPVGGQLTTANFPPGQTSHLWSILSGNTRATFRITTSGQIVVANAIRLDHETRPRYSLLIDYQYRNRDTNTNLRVSRTVEVTVLDVNEPPEPPSETMPAVDLVTGTETATLDASSVLIDPEDGDTLTYTVESSDDTVVTATISGSDITITPVAEGTATVTVTATDSEGLMATQTIPVTVRTPVTVQFQFSTYRVAETLGSFEICALSSAAVSGDIDVTFNLQEGVATEPEDYGLPSGTTTIRIVTGQTTGCVSITVVDDADVEPDEPFSANLVSISPLATSTQAFSLQGRTSTEIVILADDIGLDALALSAGTLSPTFASGTTAYTAAVGNDVESLTVTPEAFPGADITVDGTMVSNGMPSGPIALNVGTNVITVVITVTSFEMANSGTETYTVTVTRAPPPSTDATLSALAISVGTLNPAFASGTTAYTVTVADSVTSLTVTPTAADSGAGIAVDDTSVNSGASAAIMLEVGRNTITILVTAEDGVTTRTYTVAVTRESALSGLALSEGTLSPELTAGITEYDVSVGDDVESLTVTPTAVSGATVTVNGESVASGMASDPVDLAAGAATTITIVVARGAASECPMPPVLTVECFTLTVTRRSADTLARTAESVLPRVSQAMVSSIVSAITGRIDAAASGDAGSRASSLTGMGSVLSALRSAEGASGSGAVDIERALSGLSFATTLNAAEDGASGAAGSIAAWGGGDYRRLSGPDDEAVDWDGGLYGFALGADVRVRPDLLAGLSVSWNRGSFDYTRRGAAAPADGDFETRMSSVHPYVGWMPSHGSALWATVGYGQGEIAIEEQGERHESDTRLSMAAVGGSHRLLSDDTVVPGATAILRIKARGSLARIEIEGGGAALVPADEFDVRALRLAFEGSLECLGGAPGECLTPSLEIGVRHDSGDGDTGAGLDLRGGLRYTDQAAGLTVEGRGRFLALGQDGRRDWGVGGFIRFDPGADGRGLSFSLKPDFGTAPPPAGRLYDQDALAQAAGGIRPSGRMDAEIGYGFAAPAGVVTPYAGASMADRDAGRYRVGARFVSGAALAIGLEGIRQERTGADPEHRAVLRGRLDW